MAAFVATYTYASDSADLRSAHQADHIAFIEGLQAEGRLQLVGRLENAEVDILFLLKADSVDAARTALEGDPYHALGAIVDVKVYPWTARRGVLAPI